MRICVLQPTPTNIREEFPSRCLDLRFEPTCYADIGVEGAIAKAIAQMDKLYAFLSERHIPLSVGVYPWPQQLLYDKEESRQVTIWRDWCERKCRRFFNHFPVFFAYKSQHPDFMHELFIWGDSHYTALGNEIFARDLQLSAAKLPTFADRICPKGFPDIFSRHS